MTGGAASAGREKLTWSQEELDALTTEELLETYKRTGSEELKWPLVMRYAGLVKTIALETFVSKRIRGAVIDLARRQDWVPRSVRRKARDIDQASGELFSELGRYPTDQEMADRLGVSQGQYQEDLASSSMCNVLSLDALFEDRELNGGAELPDGSQDGRPEDAMLQQELLDTLTKAVASLRENEQTVISLYYHKNLSMKEIAQVMEVSEPRISQIHSRAIQKLKLYMNQYMTGRE